MSEPHEVIAAALIQAGGAAAELRRQLEAERARAAGLAQRVEELQAGIAAERAARVRAQHELAQAAAGRPFNAEVR